MTIYPSMSNDERKAGCLSFAIGEAFVIRHIEPASLPLSDSGCLPNRRGQLFQHLPQFGRQRRRDRHQSPRRELAEVRSEVGQGGGVAGQRGQGLFRVGAQVAVAETSLSAGDGELLQGLDHLGRYATAAARAAFEFGA